MSLPMVYLAGPIFGCNDDEATTWRSKARARLAGLYTCLDPMARDYRGREDDNVNDIVEGDLADIEDSDYMLVMATRPTWGTAMEISFAHYSDTAHTLVIAVTEDGPVSPWLKYHAHMLFKTLDEALDWLVKHRRAS